MARLILDRYRPIGEAGSGGFGTVQIAWDTRIQRKVAIKCIELTDVEAARAVVFSREDEYAYESDAPSAQFDANQDAPSEAWEADRWLANVPGLDEARTAAMLSDPNIVAVYDFEVQDTTAYLIMEYVDGLTLTNVLRNHDEELTLDIIASVFGDVAHALEIAHGNQVLHLDIKPDNILIDRTGRAKVTDFGLATLADAQGLGTTGGGTIGYMPLEQMRQEPLDARCDEWALASVVYEMIAGENPFRASDLVRAEAAIEQAELVVPSLCWDDLDEEADDAVFRALDPDPDERFESVAAFADELLPCLGSAKRGKKQLAAIVGGYDEDSAVEDETVRHEEARERKPRVPLNERLTDRARAVLSHVFGAAASAAVMWMALVLLGEAEVAWLSPPVIGVGLVVAAVLGAIRSHLGALVSFVCLGVAFAFAQAPVAGIALVAIAIAWWALAGRWGAASANAALAFPLLGIVPLPGLTGFAAAAPLVAGGSVRVREALATVVLGFAVVVTIAGARDVIAVGAHHATLHDLNVQNAIADVLMRPETWAALVGWVAGAAAFSGCCSRGSKSLAIVGALLGAALIVACAVGGFVFVKDALSDPALIAAAVAPPVVGATLSIAAIAAFGVPERR